MAQLVPVCTCSQNCSTKQIVTLFLSDIFWNTNVYFSQFGIIVSLSLSVLKHKFICFSEIFLNFGVSCTCSSVIPWYYFSVVHPVPCLHISVHHCYLCGLLQRREERARTTTAARTAYSVRLPTSASVRGCSGQSRGPAPPLPSAPRSKCKPMSHHKQRGDQ